MRLALLSLVLWLSMSASHGANATQEAQRQLREDAASRIAAGQFESLLAQADQALKTKERIADGRWKLALLLGGMRRGFERAVHAPEDWTTLGTRLRTLAAAHPDSPDAWLFVAVLEDSHAWATRGPGNAGSVTTMGFDAFRRYNERARAVLEEHPMRSNPAWFALRIKVGGELHESADSLDRLFDEAFKREPDYQQTWFSRVTFLEPQWGGSVADVVRFARRGADDLSPAEGRGMMARVLWLVNETGVTQALTHPDVDWNTLKASMEDVVRRYPDDWNAQPYLFESCARSDKAEARRLLALVKDAPIAELLNDNVDGFRACVEWTKSDLPAFRLRYDQAGMHLVR
ncbi:MAG TPA: hypothetical protein VIP05_28365 [Burkholderiaceae bacterium]